MKKLMTLFCSIAISIVLQAQKPPLPYGHVKSSLILDLTFTALDNDSYIQLDSIRVINRTVGGDITQYWPDTVVTVVIDPGDLLLFVGYASGYPVGIPEKKNPKNQFQVLQVYPNPVKDQAMVTINVPEAGPMDVRITDLSGRTLTSSTWRMGKGINSVLFTPGSAMAYLLTARWNGISRGIKILSEGTGTGNACRLDLISSSGGGGTNLKSAPLKATLAELSSGMLDAPGENKTYTFQFANNIACPGTPTVTYQGQTYNTIQVFSQCWMKENLNAGTMIDGGQNMTDNGIVEKYCYNNSPDSCSKYGALYQWGELMQYSTQDGAQGICPTGWHVPTDEEYKILEGVADSQYGIGDPEWDRIGFRGTDAWINLKSTTGWQEGGNGNDLLGFKALPGAGCDPTGSFNFIDLSELWWSSTTPDQGATAFIRNIRYSDAGMHRDNFDQGFGFGLRCIRDN